MAWTLIEELVKAIVVFVAGYLLSRIRRSLVSSKCCIEGCPNSAAVNMRGLCLVCYSKAKKLVEAGKVTWEKLVEKGLCKTNDPFDDAYSQAMKE